MIERFLFVITIVIGLFLMIKYLKYRQLKKVKSIADKLINTDATAAYIVYFWSPQCQQCETMQKPVLNTISHKFGYSIRKVNIVEKDNMAKQWNVRTVPSTYIMNSIGEIEFINNGFKSEKEIITQLETL
jgi:thiol-disulfide isomerase/thioredoxin